MKRTLLALALLMVGCEGVAPPTTPAPFRPEDNVVPAALEPDRPRPPRPSAVEVQRVPRAPTQ
ncbi:MAG TPA: hypothetical protein VGH63_16035 [Polyangia bacterium]